MALEKKEQAGEKKEQMESLPAPVRGRLEALIDEMIDGRVAYKEALEEFQKLYVKRTLALSGPGESINSMAERLGVDRRFLREILLKLKRADNGPAAQAEGRGKARHHFGVWDSGDERSADNDRIDRDLASEYDDSSTRA